MVEPLVAHADVRVVEGGRCARLVLHCEPADAPAIAALAGVALPSAMLRVETTGAWRALHLAPDEWLLLGPAADRDAMTARIGAAAEPHSLVDVGERNRHLRVEGPAGATLLNTGCPLDLAERAFPPGACTRTVFGKATVMIEREVDCFRMHYARSFEGYVVGLARTAAQDLPGIRPR